MIKTKLLLFILLLSLVSASYALEIPARPVSYVSDYANLLSPQTVANLNQQLHAFETKTSNQIFVAIFPSLEQESLEDFVVRLEQQWKIGQKGKDNGVLLAIFVKEHKMRIEVGYGLEGAIPDALAGNIIETRIAPSFKAGNYDEGVTQGVTAIMQASQHEYTAQKAEPNLKLFGYSFPFPLEALGIVAFAAVVGFLVGRVIGPLVALVFAYTILGSFFGLIFWIFAYICYIIIYFSLPQTYHFKYFWAFLAGGFANMSSSSGGPFFGGGNGGSSGSSGGSGGGGSSGGGGASGGW